MPNYLSLEEAAAALGVSTERLVELRSQGEVRGFRDGSSWKFPENEIERLKDELVDLGGSSGSLISEDALGISDASGSNVIGGDGEASKPGSDLEIGNELLGGGSDVNLIASDSNGSDVALVPSDSGDVLSGIDGDLLEGSELGIDELVEIDSAELQLDDPAISHDSSHLDLAIDPKKGSTGPVGKDPSLTGSGVGSTEDDSVGIGDHAELALAPESDGDLSFLGTIPDKDSGEEIIGEDSSAMDVLGSDIALPKPSSAASSLELMDGLNESGESLVMKGSSADVLSELDLLNAEQNDSGLITGDSQDLLVSSGTDNMNISSGLGSSLGDDMLGDALSESGNDLVIADDDDDLLIDSAGSDISVAGDSGINLMSPSDSGLSLESEPLDLAGSSISALDLGAELIDGEGSGSALAMDLDSGGSDVDFAAQDEEFQLSPSGIAIDTEESGSQVIEVEDSEAIGEAVEFEDADFGAADPLAGPVFAEAEPGAGINLSNGEPVSEAVGLADDAEAVGTPVVDRSAPVPAPSIAPAAGGYEIPFSIFQCLALLAIISVLSLGGMLMTDLVHNMWTYTPNSAPVSSLTDALISSAGLAGK